MKDEVDEGVDTDFNRFHLLHVMYTVAGGRRARTDYAFARRCLLFIARDVRRDVLRRLLVASDVFAHAVDMLGLDEHVGVVEVGDDELGLGWSDVVEV